MDLAGEMVEWGGVLRALEALRWPQDVQTKPNRMQVTQQGVMIMRNTTATQCSRHGLNNVG